MFFIVCVILLVGWILKFYISFVVVYVVNSRICLKLKVLEFVLILILNLILVSMLLF